MNGIENITAKILADAQAEIAALEAETEAHCQAILAQAEADAKNAYWQALNEEAQCAAQRSARAHNAAELEVRKQILSAKQEMLDAAFKSALEKLCSLPEADYVTTLAALAAAAALGGERVIFSPMDRNRVGKKVVVAANNLLEAQGKAAGLTLAEQTRDIPGGLILERGRVEINCAFDSMIAAQRSRLTGEVAKVLFD